MIENKPTVIALLTTKSLQLVDTNGANETFNFPDEHNKLKDLLHEFVGQIEFRNRTAILVLQTDLVWELVKPAKESGDSTQNEFTSSIHVDPTDLVVKKVKDDDRVYFWAARKSEYEQMRQYLAGAGINTSAVVPINALSKQPITSLSTTDAKVILNAKELVTETDFLNSNITERNLISVEPESPAESPTPISDDKVEKTTRKIDWQKYILLFAIVILSALFVGGVVVAYKSMHGTRSQKQETTPTPTLTSTPTPSPTPTIAPKSSLKIQILNGSGVVGQAAIVATSLKEAGYTNSSTANAPKHNSGKATVTFSSLVPDSYKTEITSTLKKTFPTLVSTDSASQTDWDVNILTSVR